MKLTNKTLSFLNFRSLFVVSLMALMTACGTGEITQTVGSVKSNTETNSQDILLDQDITVTFPARVLVPTVTISSFFIVPAPSTNPNVSSFLTSAYQVLNTIDESICNLDNAIAASVSCSSATSCTLTSAQNFEPATDYIICLTSDIRYESRAQAGVFQGTTFAFKTVETPSATTYSVGGTVAGLSGTVVLQNNSGDDLALTDDGDFAFAAKITDGSSYVVTVLTHPDSPIHQTCTASNNSGTVDGEDVTNVSIVCSTNTFNVGGTVTGLNGTVVLQNNAGDHLNVTANGSFSLPTALADGAGYAVTVLTNPSTPAHQTCTASNNSGTVNGEDITNVSIVCSVNSYTVGGTVAGLTGTVVLQNNAGDNLSLGANGSFTFTTHVADTADYGVTILTQPVEQTCAVNNASGTMDNGNITDVTVICASNDATISVTGSPLTLLTNGASDELIITNTSLTITATNITSNFVGTALDGNVTETGNTCSSVAPQTSCTLTYTPGGTIVSETDFPIQGSNTNAVTAAIQMDEGVTLNNVSPSSGPASGGTGVTLTGVGLTGATGVTFGGVAATSVNVVNSTTVTAVTPAHATGVVDVVITTPAGSSTDTNGYTYLTTTVGQSAYGGTIACLNGGLNNLIAATADNSTGIQWGGNGITTNAISNADGATNTATIVNCLTTTASDDCPGNITVNTYAAGVCSIYEVDSQGNTPCETGFTCYMDWYLPASDQLGCLYQNLTEIGGFNTTTGDASRYWASEEAGAFYANNIFFDTDSADSAGKSANDGNPSRVRCVSSFTP